MARREGDDQTLGIKGYENNFHHSEMVKFMALTQKVMARSK